MQLDWFLPSQTPLWGGRKRRLPVTDAYLQQNKYEVNNPKGHLVDVANCTYQTLTKGLYLPQSSYSECTLTDFYQVEHPSEEEDTSACQSPLQTFNIRNTKSTTQRDISLMSQTTQIELEQKDCFFHNLGIHNATRLSSAKSNTPLRRKTQAPVSHLCKPSTVEIRSQQPKGTSRRCRKLHRSNSNKKIVSSIF